jgi:hypothetical protein
MQGDTGRWFLSGGPMDRGSAKPASGLAWASIGYGGASAGWPLIKRWATQQRYESIGMPSASERAFRWQNRLLMRFGICLRAIVARESPRQALDLFSEGDWTG